MKRLLLACILFAGMCNNVIAQNSTIYYYYHGKKVFVPQTFERLSIGIKDQKYFAGARSTITSLLNIKLDSIKKTGAAYQFAIHLTKEQQLTAKATIAKLLKNEFISYVHPFLTGSPGTLASYDDHFVVKLKTGISYLQFKNILLKYHCNMVKRPVADNNTYLLSAGKANGFDALKMANIFFETGLFEYAQPDFTTYGGFNTPANDPLYALQWAHKNTGSPEQYNGTPGADMSIDSAWLITMGSANIKIAVIDMGVDTGHADLKQNLLQGYDCFTNTSNPGDGRPRNGNNAHGTACAGIAAAVAKNNTGIAGVAPNCKIIPVNIVDEASNFSSESGIAAGFDYAWQHGADVITNSWNLALPSGIMDDAIHRAVTQGRAGKGSIVFFATGNENSGIAYPAFNPEVIAVGGVSMCSERKSAKSCDGEYWWGSNYGAGLDVVAPCVKIATCDITGANGYNKLPGADGDYNKLFNGTSAACPHAAAVAALVLSVDSTFTAREVRTIIESTCDKAGNYSYNLTQENSNGTWNDEMGYGRVNAYKSVLAAKNKSFCHVAIQPPASNTLCKNSVATLQVADAVAASYTWRRNGIEIQTGVSVTISAGGSYDVAATFANGCTAVSAGLSMYTAGTEALKANAGNEIFLCSGSKGVRIGGAPSAQGGTPFVPAKRAFGYDKLFGTLIKFNPLNPREYKYLSLIASPEVSDNNFAAGDFTPYGYFAITRSGNLYRIDTASGAAFFVALLASEPGPNNAHEWSGLAWDPARQKLYALTFKGLVSKLYEVDPFSGTAIPIVSVPGNIITWIAFNSAGSLFGFSYNSNRILRMNKITGQIGSSVSDDIGVNNLDFLDGSFDPLDNKIYLNTYALVNQKLTEDLRVVDTLTGKVTVKGVIGTLNNVAALAIGGGNYKYTWSPSAGLSDIHDANPFANPSQTTTYTLTVTDACGQQATSQVTITTNTSKPPVKITAITDSICVGDTVRLAATKNINYKYQWYLNGNIIPGANDTSFTAKRSGRFQVSVTNGPGGCTNISPVFFVKDCSIWLNDNDPVTTCRSYFYASHGLADTSFQPDESFTKTIYPPKQGDLLKVNFSSFFMQSFDDKLTIYDGPDINAPVLAVITSPYPPLGTDIYSSNGPLTFKITSGSGPQHVGSWDAFIECYTPKVYRTRSGGDIEELSTWEVKVGPDSFTYASQLPRYIDDSIIIRSGHTVTKSKIFYNPLDQVWLQKGAKLVVKNQLNLHNGRGVDLVADGDIQIDKYGTIGGGDSLLIKGNITGEGPAIFTPCFIAGYDPQLLYFTTSCYFSSLHILNKTNVVITGLIKTDSLFMNTPGRLTIDSAELTYLLSLNNGIIDINGKGLIKSSSYYRLQLKGGSDTSFVNGPLSLPIYAKGMFTLSYPVGRNNIYKPVTLTINKQTFPFEDQYKVQAINSQPGYRPFADSSITRVNKSWHYNVTSQKRYPVTSFNITLPYGDDDGVNDPSILRIARDSAYKWVNIGGEAAYLPRSITSAKPSSTISNNTNVFGDFVLAFSRDSSGPLAVTWLSFKVGMQNKNVLLQWTTTNEENCENYIVEHSDNGIQFAPLARVLCNNSTALKNYNWLHTKPVPGINYYRIKQTDKNGSTKYSDIHSIIAETEKTFTATPNPAHDAVSITATDNIKEIHCYSATGQLLKKVFPSGKQYRLQIQELAAGVYMLRIITASSVCSKKIIKQ
jgi:subtilisin family serine protease